MRYLSNYNGYVIKENEVFVYNINFNNVIKFDTNSITEVKKHLLELDDPNLEELGFVISTGNEIDIEKKLYNSMKYKKGKLNIMLIMTYDCNCDCDYCFEDLDCGLKEKGDWNLVVNYIIKQYRTGYEELELSFFGGEPILEVDRMILIYNKLIQNDINVKSVVVTNGVLLTSTNIKELAQAGIRNFQITLDGPKEIHDNRRPCKNGESGWDAIVKNINILKANRCIISIRINIDSTNVDYLPEICSCLPDTFHDDKESLIYIASIVGCINKTSKKTLLDRAKTMKNAWEIITEYSLPILITPPVYAPCPYHSESSAYYIDLSGNIYTCGGFVGEIKRIEKVFDKFKENYYSRVRYIPNRSCFKCTFYPVCMGGCKFEEERLGQPCQYNYLKELYDTYYTIYAK